MKEDNIHLIECPRDAMQGWKTFIPTTEKIKYLNQLLKVGFHTLDFGSFVSPKAIPQMADTKEVIGKLDLNTSATKLLAIVANWRGAEEAVSYDEITYLGYPFSISKTFQLRNTNSSISDSFDVVKDLMGLCNNTKKELVIYISMAFGNPYGDKYNHEIVLEWMDKLKYAGIRIISLADTVGIAVPSEVGELVNLCRVNFPGVETGVHLHATAGRQDEKLDAAFKAGCSRFDGALKGFGGCPMADDELVGNMDSIFMIEYFRRKEMLRHINDEALEASISMANEIFKN